MVRIPKQIVTKSEKVCNRCGLYTGLYIVWKNAPICETCQEIMGLSEKKQKKIPNEKNMLTKILENSK